MNWEYVILKDRNLISVRGSGKFSVASFEEMIRNIQSDVQWQPTLDRLIDFSMLDLTGTTSGDIRASAEIHRKYNTRIGCSRIAVVFGREADFGLGRLYESFLESDILSTVKSFRTADEARQWLAEV